MARIEDIDFELAELERQIAVARNHSTRQRLRQQIVALRQEQLDLLQDERRLTDQYNRNMEEAVSIIERRLALQATAARMQKDKEHKK